MNKEFLQKFANHLKKVRKDLGLTQDDVGCEGISRQMVSLLELVKTDITLSKLKELADSMNVHIKELLDFDY